MRTAGSAISAACGRPQLAHLLAIPISPHPRDVENGVSRAKGVDRHLVRVGVDADVVRVALADHQVAAGTRAAIHEGVADLPAGGEADVVARLHVVSLVAEE